MFYDFNRHKWLYGNGRQQMPPSKESTFKKIRAPLLFILAFLALIAFLWIPGQGSFSAAESLPGISPQGLYPAPDPQTPDQV